MASKRPYGVTLLLYLVKILSVWGGIRFIATLRWWSALNEFEASLSPLYLSVTGAVWTLAGGILFWSLRIRKPWSATGILASMVVWQVELWIERVLFLSPVGNLPFAVTVSLLFSGVILVTTRHRSTLYYLHKSEEHEQPDEHPKTA